MSNYNYYAKKLDTAFTQASMKYAESWDKVRKAKQAVDTAPLKWKDRNERYEGENEAKRARAMAMYAEAQAEFKQVQKTVWNEYYDTQARLTKELNAQLREDGLASVDALDEKGVKLLDSGILKSGDLVKMAQDYEGNSTMRRLVAKTAAQMADASKDDAERRTLYSLSREIGDGQNAIERQWSNLCNVAKTYSGKNDKDGGYVTSMNKHWTDSNVRSAIDNF